MLGRIGELIDDRGRHGWRSGRPDEASHFVGGVKECLAKIVGVVDDGDFLREVCHKEEAKGLVELRHFYVETCFEVHRAGETGNVSGAGLFCRGEQVEEGCPGGVEDHGAVFYFYEMLLGRWLWLQ